MDALDFIARCATNDGLLASTEEQHNYRRVWARDGVITALGALLGADEEQTRPGRWLAQTLGTLAAHQGPVGQIPSNVTLGGPVKVSFGGNAVRVDATLWFMVGAGVLHRTVDEAAGLALAPKVEHAQRFIRSWEGNERGLLYVPRAGNWADEYPTEGYTLYDNALRVWADAEAAALLQASGHPAEARDLQPSIGEALLSGEKMLASTRPGDEDEHFCGFGTALIALLDVAGAGARALDEVERHLQRGLVPAFWPPIQTGDPLWPALQRLGLYGMRNQPHHYHNGGLWPVVSGFAALAARRRHRVDLADRIAEGIARHNREGPFPEYVAADDGSPGGTRPIAWSASAERMARATPERMDAVLALFPA